MKTITPILTFLFLACNYYVYSQMPSIQSKDALSNFLIDHPAEYIYLNTDRDIYSENDTIWFKAYLVNAFNRKPINDFRNIYVELINEQQETIIKNIVFYKDGFAASDLNLSKHKLKQGKYVLRAYTQYLRNFENDFFFEKYILIKNLHKSQFEYEEIEEQSIITEDELAHKTIDFQLMPEGGYLNCNVQNTLAYKALDNKGFSVDVTGWLYDQNNTKITALKTIHAGMGKISFEPKSGNNYHIRLDQNPEIQYKVPVSENKLVMNIENPEGSLIYITLKNLQLKNEAQKYNISCYSHGKKMFLLPILMDKPILKFSLKKKNFGFGINTITVANSEMNPLLERLVFIKNEAFLSINVLAEKQNVSNREEVKVKIETSTSDATNMANLSVTAVNRNQVISLEDYPSTIVSHLLLSSEIKGKIENPSFYFKDDSASTNEKLDLLLLTQGWRKYIWNNFYKNVPDTTFKKELGLTVSGRIKKLFNKKGIKNGEVTMFLKNNEGFFYTDVSTTNKNGKFQFPPCYIPDTSSIFIQSKSSRGNENIEVDYLNSIPNSPETNVSCSNFSIPSEREQENFNKMAYTRVMTDKAYNPGKYEILIDEVTVETNRIKAKEDDHFRIYDNADVVLVNDDKQYYPDVWSFIKSRVAGLRIEHDIKNDYHIYIRGHSTIGSISDKKDKNEALLLLDGFSVDCDMISSISVNDIDRVEVLKNIGNTAIFGSRGANGVVAVYTKTGTVSTGTDFSFNKISQQVRGYTISREFYSPVYSTKQAVIPDHRATLYWNPNIETDSLGNASLSFYSSDDTAPVLIKVEGISRNGKVGVGFTEIKMGTD
ncbi:MAG: TonB-dependent receptor plug domain-containing protein [Prolixibacteraceae bacterium]|jgi:hypothetical protein|nr:TonB-dependent receptor plug domain-containing protein [Prolixibacteraceae bacterium]